MTDRKITIPPDYRAVTISPQRGLIYFWGVDVFWWHFPLIKSVLVIAFVGWFLG